MTEEIGEYDTRINKARRVRPIPVKPATNDGTIMKDLMTGCPIEPPKCDRCEYEKRCFSLLKFLQNWIDICQQGRKKAVREQPVPKEVMIGNIRGSATPLEDNP